MIRCASTHVIISLSVSPSCFFSCSSFLLLLLLLKLQACTVFFFFFTFKCLHIIIRPGASLDILTMKDHNPARPGSRAGGITSTFLAAGALHSHSTSISSFADLSASSTNIYSSHARRVRSVRKLRQLLGPDEDVGSTERMETSINKELPLPPPPLPSPLITIPSDNALTMQPPTPLSDINSEDEEGERALSLVYARRVKLEKLKRRFGEDVPKELIFFDQPGPLSPTLNHKGRSMSSPNAMTFSESDEISRGHTKNASFSTTNPANVPALALKRSKATNMLRLWKSKSRSEDSKLPELDIVEENFDDVLQTDTEKGVGSVNAEGSSIIVSFSRMSHGLGMGYSISNS